MAGKIKKKDSIPKENMEHEEEQEEKASGKIVIFFVTILIILIWLGIIALLVKTDVGGFGSTILTPLLKDVPYVNAILPDTSESMIEDDTESQRYMYDSLDDAIARIKELELEMDQANQTIDEKNTTISNMQDQLSELESYKAKEAEFEKEREKFYEEVVFSNEAPDIKEYKAYYESIDPENAEVLYKQVVEQLNYDSEVEDYAKTYASMKPKEAAAIFDTMTGNLRLVADILLNMDTQSRANILGKMNPDTAAAVTKIMEPQN